MHRRLGLWLSSIVTVLLLACLAALRGYGAKRDAQVMTGRARPGYAETPRLMTRSGDSAFTLVKDVASKPRQAGMDAEPGNDEQTQFSMFGSEQFSMFGSEEEAPGLMAAWEREPPDTDWTIKVRDYTSKALADAELPADRLLGVDCRATLCRVRFYLPDVAEAAVLRDLRDPSVDLRVFPDAAGRGYHSVFLAKFKGGLTPARFADLGIAGRGGSAE